MHKNSLLALAAGIAVAGSWYLHRLAGLGMPLPWADECLFVFPAINLADHHTLFSPEVNPERHLMWMPPGYSIVLASVFKILPYSLQLARDLSWLFVALLFLGLLRLLKHAAPYWSVIALTSAFLLAPHFIVAGNNARMDALLLCIAVWGWFLVTRGSVYYGIALLLASTLIHPHGLYYLGAAVVYAAVRWRKSWPRPSGLQTISVVTAMLLIGVYVVYVLQHQSEFVMDMQFQLARKASRNTFERLFSDSTMVSLLAGYGLAILIGTKFARRHIPLLVFGGLSLIVPMIGLEMWYHVYVAVAALILQVVFIGFFSDLLDRTRLNEITRIGLLGVLLVGMLGWSFFRGLIANPKRYPDKLSWLGMQMDPAGEYLTKEERSRLIYRLNAMTDSLGSARIAFDPEGDALAVWRKADCRFVPYYPMFTTTKPDVVVIHTTRFLPAWWKGDDAKARWEISERDLYFVSDDGDRWYVKVVNRH